MLSYFQNIDNLKSFEKKNINVKRMEIFQKKSIRDVLNLYKVEK